MASAISPSLLPFRVTSTTIGRECVSNFSGNSAWIWQAFFSLAGIVINNAIVLIDRIQIEVNELNRPIEDAIIAACLQRFRPILLATFTTVLGLIPLYLSGGEMWEGMAISIMIGLLFGTVITLLFIPSFYSILFKVNYKGYTFDESIMED